MKAVYFPEKLTWTEKITESASGVDIVLKATTPMNTYAIALVIDGKKLPSPKLKCSGNIGGAFSWQTFLSVEEAKLIAQRHYESVFGDALERNAEFLIDVSEVVLIRPDSDGEKIEVVHGVEATSLRRTGLADTWRLSCGVRWFSKSTGEFNSLSDSYPPDDDVDFVSFEEAKKACEQWAKVNL